MFIREDISFSTFFDETEPISRKFCDEIEERRLQRDFRNPKGCSYRANIAFHRRGELAEETGIPELKSMARTIRDKLDGITSFRTFRHVSNAKMEGFNNKLRRLIKQAYGFRDRESFPLRIHQLPEISSAKEV